MSELWDSGVEAELMILLPSTSRFLFLPLFVHNLQALNVHGLIAVGLARPVYILTTCRCFARSKRCAHIWPGHKSI